MFIESFTHRGQARHPPQVQHILDMAPTSYAGLDTLRHPPPHPPLPNHPPPCAPAPPHIPTPIPEPTLDTKCNHFGVFRRYTTQPTYDPEDGLTIDTFTTLHTHTCPASTLLQRTTVYAFGSQALATLHDQNMPSFAPFANISIFRMMH